ncbi:MAG: HAD family hydrolase [Anaerolineae bacterium]|nr:HAD family hydrolase [Anaerolineae bacterium]
MHRDAIKKAIANDIRVVLATGKTRTSAEGIIKDLGLDTPGVYVQGLMICNADGTIRKQTTMDKAAARKVINYAENNGFEVMLYSGNRLLAKHAEEPFSEITKYGEPAPVAVGSLVNNLDSTQIHKVVVLSNSPRKLKALRWQLNQQVGQQVSFTTAAVLTSLEVLPKGGSKANGVRVLLKDLGVALENVMAIGDGENDADMLKMVGLGVAMGNATEAVKAAANEVVSNNNNHGVAEAITKFALPKEEPKEEAKPEPIAPAETTKAESIAKPATTTTEAPSESKAEGSKE